MKRKWKEKWKVLDKKIRIFYISIAGCLTVAVITVSVAAVYHSVHNVSAEAVQTENARENMKSFGSSEAISASGYVSHGNLSQNFTFSLSYNGETVAMEVEEVGVSAQDEVKKGDEILKVSADSYQNALTLLEKILTDAQKNLTKEEMSYNKAKLEAEAEFVKNSGLNAAAEAEYQMELSDLSTQVQEAADALADANNTISGNPVTTAENQSVINSYSTEITSSKTGLTKAEAAQKQTQSEYQKASSQYSAKLWSALENLAVQKYLTQYSGQDNSQITKQYQEIQSKISDLSGSSQDSSNGQGGSGQEEQSGQDQDSDGQGSGQGTIPEGGGTPPTGENTNGMAKTSLSVSTGSLFVTASAAEAKSEQSDSTEATDQYYDSVTREPETEAISEREMAQGQKINSSETQSAYQVSGQAESKGSEPVSGQAESKGSEPVSGQAESKGSEPSSGQPESKENGSSTEKPSGQPESGGAGNTQEGGSTEKESSSLTNSEKQIQTLQEEYKTLESACKTLKTEFNSAKSAYEEAKQTVSDLNTLIAQDEKNKTELEEKNTKMAEETAKASSNLASLQLAYTEAVNDQAIQAASLKEEYKFQMSTYDAAADTLDITMAVLDKELKSSQDAVTDAEEELNLYKEQFDSDGTLKASYEGILQSVGYQSGDYLSAQIPVVVYQDQNVCTVTVSVSQDDIASVEVGDSAMLTGDSGRFSGTVSAISQQAESQGISNVTYDVTVTVEDEEHALTDGLEVSVYLNMENTTPQGMPEGSSGEMPSGVPEESSGEMPSGVPEGSSGEMPSGVPEGSSGEMPSGEPNGNNGEMPSGAQPQSSGSDQEETNL